MARGLNLPSKLRRRRMEAPRDAGLIHTRPVVARNDPAECMQTRPYIRQFLPPHTHEPLVPDVFRVKESVSSARASTFFQWT